MLDWYELWYYLAYKLCGLTKQPIVTAAAPALSLSAITFTAPCRDLI